MHYLCSSLAARASLLHAYAEASAANMFASAAETEVFLFNMVLTYPAKVHIQRAT